MVEMGKGRGSVKKRIPKTNHYVSVLVIPRLVMHSIPASSLTEPRMIQGQWLGWDLSAAQIGTRSNGAAGWAGPFAR
jgi:hypothetical protein